MLIHMQMFSKYIHVCVRDVFINTKRMFTVHRNIILLCKHVSFYSGCDESLNSSIRYTSFTSYFHRTLRAFKKP